MFLQPATQPVSHRFETLEIFFTPPDITSRRLGFVSPFANDYISMLSSLPHLKKLALPTHPPCHLLPDALIATPTSYICPELAELCLYESSESVSWDTVLAVVKSRTDPDIGGVSLRELTVPRYVRSDDKVVGLSAYVRVKAPA
ncbi:hypothetical protein BOTBODRAFT_32946 [Botryobasidium botryosum FD-172 SS1]|uniref:Uncharacterized protein n=1 Tax=Botryobasidium botryosum (strain FD-172 SS1) TaxID=930990 RepID=A0A067MF19_BOTB1|nr:hypothetical protein BOTBODRAFT_32946 [Botryobasidium botryosum FD-172 SS1]